MTNTQVAFIEEIAKGAGASPEFVDSIKQEAAERALTNHLLALRGAKGISQEQIAKHFGCSQSKISKLENGLDTDLSMGDLLQYCDAIGLELSVGLSPKGNTSIDRVRQHAFFIKDELSRLVSLAEGDETMASGLANTLGEVLFNLVKLVAVEADKLPNHPQSDEPRIKIEARCEIIENPKHVSNIDECPTIAATDSAPQAIA